MPDIFALIICFILIILSLTLTAAFEYWGKLTLFILGFGISICIPMITSLSIMFKKECQVLTSNRLIKVTSLFHGAMVERISFSKVSKITIDTRGLSKQKHTVTFTKESADAKMKTCVFDNLVNLADLIPILINNGFTICDGEQPNSLPAWFSIYFKILGGIYLPFGIGTGGFLLYEGIKQIEPLFIVTAIGMVATSFVGFYCFSFGTLTKYIGLKKMNMSRTVASIENL